MQQASSTYDHSAWNPGIYLGDNTVVLLEQLQQGTQNKIKTELNQEQLHQGTLNNTGADLEQLQPGSQNINRTEVEQKQLQQGTQNVVGEVENVYHY